MGKKLLVSLAMEGKFANQGLQALDDDDDILTAMARELVTEKGVGQKADALWREIQQQHTRLLGTTNVVVIAQPEATQNGPCLPESDPPLRPLQSHAGLRLHLRPGQQHHPNRPDHFNRRPAKHNTVHPVRMRHHRTEPAGRYRSEIDRHTPAMRIAHTNTNLDGYTQLHTWLVCGCQPPDRRRARGWRLFPGQWKVLCDGRTQCRHCWQRFHSSI